MRQPCPGIAKADQPQPDFSFYRTVYLFGFGIFTEHLAIRPSQDRILKPQPIGLVQIWRNSDKQPNGFTLRLGRPKPPRVVQQDIQAGSCRIDVAILGREECQPPEQRIAQTQPSLDLGAREFRSDLRNFCPRIPN